MSGIRDRATAATAALYEGREVARHVVSVDSISITFLELSHACSSAVICTSFPPVVWDGAAPDPPIEEGPDGNFPTTIASFVVPGLSLCSGRVTVGGPESVP